VPSTARRAIAAAGRVTAPASLAMGDRREKVLARSRRTPKVTLPVQLFALFER